MDADEYEVFKGAPARKPFLLGIVRGLDRANELMNRMHERMPDYYFMRRIGTKESVASLPYKPASASAQPDLLARTETFEQPESSIEPNTAA